MGAWGSFMKIKHRDGGVDVVKAAEVNAIPRRPFAPLCIRVSTFSFNAAGCQLMQFNFQPLENP